MILGLLQARVSSRRLPRKVLLPILDRPMILRQIERIRRSEGIDRLMVVTSTEPSDDPLCELCAREGLEYFRGSLDDVLDRFFQAAKVVQPQYVVRLTGDCPLIDPSLIDRLIGYAVDSGLDYASTALRPTFPDGLDAEIIRYSTLEAVWQQATLRSEREHVTPYIYKNPEKFKIGSIESEIDLSELRWTVDQQVDYEVVEAIYSALYPGNPHFSTEDILAFLGREPRWREHNSRLKRNEGYAYSLSLEDSTDD